MRRIRELHPLPSGTSHVVKQHYTKQKETMQMSQEKQYRGQNPRAHILTRMFSASCGQLAVRLSIFFSPFSFTHAHRARVT